MNLILIWEGAKGGFVAMCELMKRVFFFFHQTRKQCENKSRFERNTVRLRFDCHGPLPAHIPRPHLNNLGMRLNRITMSTLVILHAQDQISMKAFLQICFNVHSLYFFLLLYPSSSLFPPQSHV